MDMIRKGGRWRNKHGFMVGEGLVYHYKAAIRLLCPQIVFNKWLDLIIENYVDHRSIVVLGPASSGKTMGAALCVLLDYYCFPYTTTVIICSTTRQRLEDRIWGELKSLHKRAKAEYDWLPGNLIEGLQRLVTDDRSMAAEGRDFRNGIVGVPCVVPGSLVDTPFGPKPIETLRIGDKVVNASGWGKITNVHFSHANRLVRVRLRDGRLIECTGDHPIFTMRGWVAAVDLRISDKVLSARETMQILWKNASPGLSEQEILRRSMSGSSPARSLQTVPDAVSSVESQEHMEESVERFLQSGLRWSLGRRASRDNLESESRLPALRQGHDRRSPPTGILLCQVPTAPGALAVFGVRTAFCFDTGKAAWSTDAVLQRVLQAEIDWQVVSRPVENADPSGVGPVAVLPVINPPLSDSLRGDWGLPSLGMVRDRFSVSRNQIGDRGGRRNPSDAPQEGQAKGREYVDCRMASVEILEPGSDPRYDESAGGYPVYNLEVEGHPSYSVNGVIVHNCKKGENFVGLGDFAGLKNKRVRLVGDELCFPAGTMVDSPNGQIPIETLKPGDRVFSAVGEDRVLANSSHLSPSLLRVKTKDGRQIVCTPNHPFLTQFGWKKACEVDEGCYLVSTYEAVRILRKDYSRNWTPEVLPGLRQTESALPALRAGVSCEAALFDSAFLRSVLQREIHAQPDSYPAEALGKNVRLTEEIPAGQPRFFKEDGRSLSRLPLDRRGSEAAFRNDESSRHKTAGARRQWHRSYQGRDSACESDSGCGLEFWHQDRPEKRQRVSSGLQDGCGVARLEVRGRGGRIYAQQSDATSERPKEGRLSSGAWVDCVEILEQDDPRFSVARGCDDGYRVYNLRVEKHPSFSVSGLLVHNSLLPRVFVDSISNLDKNPDFKCVGLGNPKDVTDALGILAEPAAKYGGWDGGVDQTPKTKTWETRRPDGICIQLVGSDSPNLDGKLGIPLITQQQINRDVEFYGTDSLWYTMMNQGMMPRGQGSRRVLTRAMCVKFGALEPPIWQSANRIKVAFLDAAYRGVGGDRCIFGMLEFGSEAPKLADVPGVLASALVSQVGVADKMRQVMALLGEETVPIKQGPGYLPEDQIVDFVKTRCEREGIPPKNFFYDSGMRSSLVTAFGRLWSTDVNAIDCGGKPSERQVSGDIDVKCCDYYSKFITELWYTVRLIVESSQMRGFTEEVIAEFSAREWTMVGKNKIEVEPKDKMKLKFGRSPDLADAFAIGCEGARRLGFVIKRTLAIKHTKQDDAWKRDLREKADAIRREHQLDAAA
jgi:hypothetical protein